MAKPPPKPTGTPPTISGVPRVGQTLHASDGSWSGGPVSFGKQWLQDTTPIFGATAPDYVPVAADEGHMIRVIGTATDKNGTKSEGVTSEGVGPIKPVAVPPQPIPPEPPPSGDYPDSIINPVQGVPVPHVWDLQFGGTGVRTEFPNGAWSGEIDPYLASLGFVRGNYDNALYLPGGPALVKVEGYSFKGSPRINLFAPELELWDVEFNAGGDASWPTDVNNNIQFESTQRIRFHFCTWDGGASYQGSGDTEFHDCLMTGQPQGFCDVGNLDDGVTGQNTSTLYNRCYIPGGGIKPGWAAHVELARIPAAPGQGGNRRAHFTDTMVDGSACGQADTANYGGGWTGVWSVGDLDVQFNRCVMIGAPKVNASPTVPNSVGCVVAFGERPDRPGPKLTDCVLEPGCYGYTYNHTGGSTTKCEDGGGNRSLENAALGIAELSRRLHPHGHVNALIRPDLFD